MNRLFLLSLLALSITAGCFAQNDIKINQMKLRFLEFEYERVVGMADSLLMQKQQLSQADLITVYLYKGVAHYSLDDEPQARRCFIEILKIDRLYVFDADTFSPKIAALFDQIKGEYQQLVVPTLPTVITVLDSAAIKERDALRLESGIKKSMLWRSLLLPGWGHLYGGDSQKGTILTSASALLFSASIYLVFDARSKELDYLSSNSTEAISSAYSKYNTAYKARNVFLITSVLLWIYTQADLVYLQPVPENISFRVVPATFGQPGVAAAVTYPF